MSQFDTRDPLGVLEERRRAAISEVTVTLSALEVEQIVQEWTQMREEVESMREQVDDAVAQLKELQDKGYRPWDPTKHQEAMDSLKKAQETLEEGRAVAAELTSTPSSTSQETLTTPPSTDGSSPDTR